MASRLGSTVVLGAFAAFGLVAALAIASLRLGPLGAGADASPTPPQPTRTVAGPSTGPTPSPRLVTLPPPSPSAQSTVTPVPEPTPWPDWLVIPDDLGHPDDPDLDGLRTAREEGHGTDPFNWDSDNGLESDGSEVAAGRDPLDRDDDVRAKSVCIPDDAERFDVPSDGDPPPAPELEALVPEQIAGMEMQIASMRGLPRVYGFFNFFWDALLACAGGKPADLSHALALRGTPPAFAIMAIHVDGANAKKLGRDLLHDMAAEGLGRSFAVRVDVDGLTLTILIDTDVGGISFAAYATDDVLFLMTGMSFTDAGLWAGGVLDPEHVREALAGLPRS